MELSTVSTGVVEAAPVTWSTISLHFSRELTPQEFTDLGQQLNLAQRGIQFWVGDWYVYGENLYKEDVAQYVSACLDDMYVEKSLQNIVNVAKNVPPSRRRENLSWSHHEAVAYDLEEDQQERLLRDAENQGWTVKRLREEVRLEKKQPPKERWERVSVEEFISEDGEICRRIIERKVA